MKYIKFKYLLAKNKKYIAAFLAPPILVMAVSYTTSAKDDFFTTPISHAYSEQLGVNFTIKNYPNAIRHEQLSNLSQKLNKTSDITDLRDFRYIYNYQVACKICNIDIKDTEPYPVFIDFQKYINKTNQEDSFKIYFPPGYQLKNNKNNFYTVTADQFSNGGSRYFTLYNEKTQKSKIIIYKLNTLEEGRFLYGPFLVSLMFSFLLSFFLKENSKKLHLKIMELFTKKEHNRDTYKEAYNLAIMHLHDKKVQDEVDNNELLKTLSMLWPASEENGNTLDTSNSLKDFLSFVNALSLKKDNTQKVLQFLFFKSFELSEEKFKMIHDHFKDNKISYLKLIDKDHIEKVIGLLKFNSKNEYPPHNTRLYQMLVDNYHYPITNDMLVGIMKEDKKSLLDNVFDYTFSTLSLKELQTFVRNNTGITPEIEVMLEKRQIDNTIVVPTLKKATHKI